MSTLSIQSNISNPVYVSDKQLAIRYGVHRTTVWRWIRNGEFPKPIKISEGCTRWRLSEVEQWESEQLKASGLRKRPQSD